VPSVVVTENSVRSENTEVPIIREVIAFSLVAFSFRTGLPCRQSDGRPYLDSWNRSVVNLRTRYDSVLGATLGAAKRGKNGVSSP
jgi:hypothetical protein